MKSPVTSITDEQLADMEELCSKATQGEWWIDSHGVTMMAMDSLEVVFTTPCDPKTAARHPETGNLSSWRNDWDASYIATACPSKVQSLIARLRAAEADAKRYRWLRNPDQDVALVLDKITGHVPVDRFGGGGYPTYEYRAGEELDQAIDAAMERKA